MMKMRLSVVLLLSMFAAGGCSLLGLFGPKGPQTFTVFFSTETEGELKPCG